MTIFPPSRCFLFSCILHAWRVCPYLLQFPALPSRAVLQFILESVISLGVTNIYIYMYVLYIYVYIYIYLHERISEACIGRPSRGMSSNPSHSLMPTSPWWLWNLYSWGKSLQNPLVKAGFDSSAFPFFNGHTRGIQGIHIFRHTHMCNAGQQPAGSHMQFFAPPQRKSHQNQHWKPS